MQRKIIPDIVERQEVASLTERASVFEAAKMMAQNTIAAVIVNDDAGQLIGIITERDLTQRVLAEKRDPQTTTVGDVMTAKPDTLSPDDRATDALELMQTRRYRHLPVIEGGQCVAMVSVRDLFAAVKEGLEESIRETEAFVFGDRYGA